MVKTKFVSRFAYEELEEELSKAQALLSEQNDQLEDAYDKIAELEEENNELRLKCLEG